MSQINEEVQKLCEISEKSKGQYYFKGIGVNQKTYYVDANIENQSLKEFDVNTPKAMIENLQKLWDQQETVYMRLFAVPLTVAAFKNKDKIVEEKEISPFIYEF